MGKCLEEQGGTVPSITDIFSMLRALVNEPNSQCIRAKRPEFSKEVSVERVSWTASGENYKKYYWLLNCETKKNRILNRQT